MPSLEEFLRTGKLGPLHFGMTVSDVVAHLGAATDESVRREPRILKYGALQVTFARPAPGAEPRLTLIGIYYRPPLEPLPGPVVPTDFVGTSATSVGEVQEFLHRAGLCATNEGEGEDLRLTMPSGAQIVFGDRRLHSAQFAARIAPTAKKQISVSIPEDAWQQLHSLAGQSNQSVAALCAQWIAQRASELRPETK